MEELTLEALLAKIKDANDKVRAAAWQGAGPVGAAAMQPLAEIAADASGGKLEIARSANRAMWQIVRHVGRPGADAERKAVCDALVPLVGAASLPVQLRRDVIWMLSEIFDPDMVDVEGAAALLGDADLRDDARMALQRVPGEKSLAALKTALERSIDDEFKQALACSLRRRGVDVPNVPCDKLKPRRPQNAAAEK
jgi:hypothetical protein